MPDLTDKVQGCFSRRFSAVHALYSQTNGKRRLAFKIKLLLPPDERKRLQNEAYDFCFNLLSKTGIRADALGELFLRVEAEDLKPFVTKVMDVTAYIASHPDIRDREQYLRTSLESWLDDWLLRYQDISEWFLFHLSPRAHL